MTNDELSEIEARVEKATPGPWEWSNFICKDGRPIQSNEDVAGILAESASKGTVLSLHGVMGQEAGEPLVVCYTGNGKRSEANAGLIVTAVYLLPKLLAEVKRLREENKQVENKLRLFLECDKELDRMRKQIAAMREVVEAAKEYESEWKAPVKDLALRIIHRRDLFTALAKLEGKP